MQTIKYDFMAKRKMFFGISGAILAVILLCTLIFGVQLDLEFKGGAMLTLGYEGEIELAEVEKATEEALGCDVRLQTGSNLATGHQSLTVTMPGVQTVTAEQLEALTAGLNEKFADNAFEQLRMRNVNATLGREFLAKCLVAVLGACVLILAYVAVRFRKIGGLPAGIIAVIALVNDLLVVFGCFVVLRIPLDGNFIAAMLTILGYSINDTVVVYDRIRENRKLLGKKAEFTDLVNLSLNQSLRRSVNTTVTTCAALAVICVVAMLFGLQSILTFAFPLMVGMVSGLYTSLFLTTSLWVEWESRKAAKAKK